jgi:GTP cyclohydrolase I
MRSVARLAVRFADGAPLDLIALIDRVEQALGTPVQAAVKREDEQAFARANGANPMFCEDAARRILHALDDDGAIVDFHVRVEHRESLHPHDAVVQVGKPELGERGELASWPAVLEHAMGPTR